MHTILIWATFISTFLICFAVWRMLATALENTGLDAKTKRRFKVAAGSYLFGWYFLMALLAGAGIYTASPSLRLPSISIAFGVFVPIAAGLILLKISPSLRLIVSAIPQQRLIGVQFYRVLGAIFIGFYLLSELPAEFALPAGIGDIIVGAAAPLVAYLTAKNYPAANKWRIVCNVFGILDLIVHDEIMPVVSAVTLNGRQPFCRMIGAFVLLTVHAPATFERYQPLSPSGSVGLIDTQITGGARSLKIGVICKNPLSGIRSINSGSNDEIRRRFALR